MRPADLISLSQVPVPYRASFLNQWYLSSGVRPTEKRSSARPTTGMVHLATPVPEDNWYCKDKDKDKDKEKEKEKDKEKDKEKEKEKFKGKGKGKGKGKEKKGKKGKREKKEKKEKKERFNNTRHCSPHIPHF